jgi:hypothetical protein
MYSSSLNNFNYFEDFIDNEKRTKNYLPFVLNSQTILVLFRIAFDFICKF